jgi:hypothetical protein
VKREPGTSMSSLFYDESHHLIVSHYIFLLLFEHRCMDKQLHSNFLWSQSQTKEALTTFAEGISCRIYDEHIHYTTFYQGEKKWIVIANIQLNFESFKTNDYPKFVHPRCVSVSADGFMRCDCYAYIQRLHPCCHMGAVFHQLKKLFSPEHFHLRYWKIYNQFYDRPSIANEEVVRTLSNSLKEIRRIGFQGGTFKGIPVGDVFHDTDEPTKSTARVSLFTEEILRKGYLIQYSRRHHDILSAFNANDEIVDNIDSVSQVNARDNDDGFEVNFQDDLHTDDSGLYLRTELHLTQDNRSANISDVPALPLPLSKEQVKMKLTPIFDSIIHHLSDIDELQDVEGAMTCIANRLMGLTVQSNEDVFGTTGAPALIQKRRRFAYENH